MANGTNIRYRKKEADSHKLGQVGTVSCILKCILAVGKTQIL